PRERESVARVSMDSFALNPRSTTDIDKQLQGMWVATATSEVYGQRLSRVREDASSRNQMKLVLGAGFRITVRR
ncbi:MAG TPA: hypothetical protein VKP30_33405, partial [Polyangiaceae bacterium]|nr:hypothetical protein [Polyangiaceae bacterium]